MNRPFLLVSLGAASVTLLLGACSLNPQPLPPLTGGGTDATTSPFDGAALHSEAGFEDATPGSADGAPDGTSTGIPDASGDVETDADAAPDAETDGPSDAAEAGDGP
jgi:hypothetical protein